MGRAGRPNDPCPCSSGIKFKNCCGRPAGSSKAAFAGSVDHGAVVVCVGSGVLMASSDASGVAHATRQESSEMATSRNFVLM